MDQDVIRHGSRPWPWPHCVRWGPSSLSPKGYDSPQFSAYVYCGQTAGWIKIPLGTEVGFDPADIVLDGDPAPPRKGVQQPPSFRSTLLWHGRQSQQLLNSCYLCHAFAFLTFFISSKLFLLFLKAVRKVSWTRAILSSNEKQFRKTAKMNLLLIFFSFFELINLNNHRDLLIA